MKSTKLGMCTSGAEVTNVSANGLWLLVDDRELFVAFEHFPWFADATIRQLARLERPGPHHLYWPDLAQNSGIGMNDSFARDHYRHSYDGQTPAI